MKLTTIIAASLPFFAYTTALPNQGPGGIPSAIGQWSGGEAAPSNVGPLSGDESRPEDVWTQMDEDQDQELSNSTHLQRDLETRGLTDRDWLIKECRPATINCKTHVIIPKGKDHGGCVNSLNGDFYDGSIHIIDAQAMCRYYRQADCRGEVIGPHNNAEMEYSIERYMDGWFLWKPASFQCQIITFGEGTVPVTKKAEGHNQNT